VVCDRQPGETLTDEDLDIVGVDVAHLIASGHIESTTTKRSVAVQDQKEGN
jgi:hypothetical protein